MEKFAKVAKKRNSRRKSNNKDSVATAARKGTFFVEEKTRGKGKSKKKKET